MLAFPREGFVFLAMPKCASTAIEQKLVRRSKVALSGAGLKHVSMSEFERFVQPMLEHAGHARSSYEVVCLFREPVDWVQSWWRYRSRPSLADHPNRRQNFAGGVSFEEFAEAYIERSTPYARVDGGSQSAFVRGVNADVGVDRIFRYEELEKFVSYVEGKLRRDVTLEHSNASPDRPRELSEQAYNRLVAHLQPEYEIYSRLQ